MSNISIALNMLFNFTKVIAAVHLCFVPLPYGTIESQLRM